MDQGELDLEQKFIEFEKDGKTYEYTGTVNGDNVFMGRGDMKYPNGMVYEGEFEAGLRHGFGKLIFPKQEGKVSGFVFGQFVRGAPNEEWKSWKIVYDSNDQYWGSIYIAPARRNQELLSLEDFEKHAHVRDAFL